MLINVDSAYIEASLGDATSSSEAAALHLHGMHSSLTSESSNTGGQPALVARECLIMDERLACGRIEHVTSLKALRVPREDPRAREI